MKNIVLCLLFIISTTILTTKAFSGVLQIVSLNLGAGQKGLNYNNACPIKDFTGGSLGYEQTVFGQKRYIRALARKAYINGVDEQVIFMQEVDRITNSNRFDTGRYFQNRLNEMPDMGERNWNHLWSKSINHDGGEFGLATIYSNTFDKVKTKAYDLGLQNTCNKVFQAVKVRVQEEFFWLVNVHFCFQKPYLAIAHLYKVLEFTESLASHSNIIIAGDFNIWREGYHQNICKNENDTNCVSRKEAGAHKVSYEYMTSLFEEFGFKETSDYKGPCWKNSSCSFKASGKNYAQLDYAFLKPRKNLDIQTKVTFNKPTIENKNCILSDHYSLILDLSW